MTSGGEGTMQCPYDNAKSLNNLNAFCQSIENNEQQPFNIPPKPRRSSNEFSSRKSLSKYRTEIGRLHKQIFEHLAKHDDGKENVDISKNDNEFLSSQTELKTTYPTGGTSSESQSENEIYSTRIQEGDNNLMFVCEPKATQKKTCFRQVGNNNVLVNLHMSMVSNCCQILYNDGKVFQLDSDGEFWLEIKLRRNKDKEPNSNASNTNSNINVTSEQTRRSSDSKTPTQHSHYFVSPRTSADSEIHKTDMRDTRLPRENSDYFESPRSSVDSVLLYAQTVQEHTKWDCSASEYYTASDESVQVFEREDAILVQVEAPSGVLRPSDYGNLADCVPVQKALTHNKVIDFLNNQTGNVDFDVDVTHWEYEKEPLYDIVDGMRKTSVDEEGCYSEVNPVLSSIRRKPTLPPRLRIASSPVSENTGVNATSDGMPVVSTTPSREIRPEPELPRRRRRLQPSENVDQSFPPVSLILPDDEVSGTKTNTKSPKDIPMSMTAGNRSPADELLDPPVPRPPPRSPVLVKPERKSLPDSLWYHGEINNEKSKAFLHGKPTGSFLVRDSSDTSGPHKYTLEFVTDGAVRRLKILKKDVGYHLKESTTMFDSVVQLVEEAMKTGLEIRDSKVSDHWTVIKIAPVERPPHSTC